MQPYTPQCDYLARVPYISVRCMSGRLVPQQPRLLLVAGAAIKAFVCVCFCLSTPKRVAVSCVARQLVADAPVCGSLSGKIGTGLS